MFIFIWILQLVLIPILSPLFIGIVKKIKAKFQNRNGSSVFQLYKDLWKLFQKDEVISRDASWIFKFAPYLIFAITIILGVSIPLFTSILNNPLSDFLTIIYLIALQTFFLALAGIDVGNAFGGFGSSREMTVATLTEAGLLFSILSLSFLSHSTNFFTIVGNISSLSFFSFAPIIFAFTAFIISMLAETARFPFDNPATHLELTMIHEAMILEYSGKRLALIEWAAANKFLIFLTLGANLFCPWGISWSSSLSNLSIAFLYFLGKVFILSLFVAVLESIIAKFRFFRLPDLLFSSFILSIISISLIV